MGNHSCHLTCDNETKELIMVQCIEEFRNQNPSFYKIKLSSKFILNRIAKYYLGEIQNEY